MAHIFINPDDIPEEIKEAIQQHIDQNHMRQEALINDLNRMIENMPPDDLLAFRHLMGLLVSGSPQGNAQLAGFWDGFAASVLKHRHDVCPGCGENHDKLILDAANAEVQARMKAGEPVPADVQPELPEDGEVPASEAMVLIEGTDVSIPADLARAMDEFNLNFIADPDLAVPDWESPVKCNNCGQEYVSLRDRMLKPPGVEHCPGCVNKTKWG